MAAGARRHLLAGARAYLSGPMDFVASREEEMRFGWRNRIGEFLRSLGVIVFDPWNKPQVRGLHEYGAENAGSQDVIKREWSYDPGSSGARARDECCSRFYATQHIDLRMVDTSDFIVAYCPTNVYSVGTVHEIVTARLQRKPVLFVSPPFEFQALQALREHLKADRAGLRLVDRLVREGPLKSNPQGLPSLWYMPLLGGHSFFDGFGFETFRRKFRWQRGPMDEREAKYIPRRPLLPFLLQVDRRTPKRFSRSRSRMVPDEDWLIWELGERPQG